MKTLLKIIWLLLGDNFKSVKPTYLNAKNSLSKTTR